MKLASIFNSLISSDGVFDTVFRRIDSSISTNRTYHPSRKIHAIITVSISQSHDNRKNTRESYYISSLLHDCSVVQSSTSKLQKPVYIQPPPKTTGRDNQGLSLQLLKAGRTISLELERGITLWAEEETPHWCFASYHVKDMMWGCVVNEYVWADEIAEQRTMRRTSWTSL